jgi:hypothetical protein
MRLDDSRQVAAVRWSRTKRGTPTDGQAWPMPCDGQGLWTQNWTRADFWLTSAVSAAFQELSYISATIFVLIHKTACSCDVLRVCLFPCCAVILSHVYLTTSAVGCGVKRLSVQGERSWSVYCFVKGDKKKLHSFFLNLIYSLRIFPEIDFLKHSFCLQSESTTARARSYIHTYACNSCYRLERS